MMLAAAGASLDGAPLRLLPPGRPHAVFGGGPVDLELMFRNPNATTVRSELRAQIFQASSATVAPSSDSRWKALQVLPGQTVVETAALRFPAVQAETRFLVRWVDAGREIIGTTDVHVLPTNLLARLGAVVGGEPVGVFDPGDQLKPLLRGVGVAVQDLLATGGGEFAGRLAIFGPFDGATSSAEPATEEIRRWAKRGKACVWLQAADKSGVLRPSFQVVRLGGGTVVVARPEMVSRLDVDPEAQLNLIHLAEYALQPARLDLLAFEPQTTPAP